MHLAASSSLVGARTSTRKPPTCTSQQPTPSRCRSNVSPSSYTLIPHDSRRIVFTHPWVNTSDRPSEDREAGQTFEKAAKIEIDNLKEPDEAANTYLDAFKVYRNDSPDDAVRCADFTITRWCTKGNFRRAATQKETLGDMFETQVGDLKRAQEAYEAAAGWYEGDGAAAYV